MKSIVKKYKFVFIGIGVISQLIGFLLGYNISKTKYSPKLVKGMLIIDHTEDQSKPAIYLGEMDPIILDPKTNSVVLKTIHIR